MSTNTAQQTVTDNIAATAASRMSKRRIGLVVRSSESASEPIPSEPHWQPFARPASATPTTDEVLHAVRAPGKLAAPVELALFAALTRPLSPHESHREGNDKREGEIRALFDQLTPLEAFDLRRRLEQNRDNDAVALGFRRLVVERRDRLKAYLANARRRSR